jgi:hypothetical protein
MTPVTLVTKDATLDNLSTNDYRDIFTELRQNLSLDKLIGVMGSSYSKATWSKYERNELELNRTMRSELRRAVNLPALPETVTEAVNNRTSPDAEVWAVGDGAFSAGKVLLISGEHQDLVLHVNGAVQAMPHSTGVTSVTTGATPRKPLVRPVASIEQNERRAALLASWKDVIEAGLRVLENRHAN